MAINNLKYFNFNLCSIYKYSLEYHTSTSTRQFDLEHTSSLVRHRILLSVHNI